MATRKLCGDAGLNRAYCAEGGLLQELYQADAFGQLTLRIIPTGCEAGGHRHPKTNEWWIVARGEALLWLEYPNGIKEIRVAAASRPEVVRVPAGTGHTIRNIGREEVVLLFWASRVYDPEVRDKEKWSW